MKPIGLFALSLLLALTTSPVLARKPAPALPPAIHATVLADDGLPLALWSRSAAQPTRTVLLVHGRTWSARPNFDLQTPEGDRSVLKAFAERGYAAYAWTCAATAIRRAMPAAGSRRIARRPMSSRCCNGSSASTRACRHRR